MLQIFLIFLLIVISGYLLPVAFYFVTGRIKNIMQVKIRKLQKFILWKSVSDIAENK